MARRLPEVEEGKTYGVHAPRVRGSLMARLLEDRTSILVKVDADERATLCASRPDTFAIGADDRNYAVMIVRLSTVGAEELWRVLETSWRRSAPPSLVAGYDANRPGS